MRHARVATLLVCWSVLGACSSSASTTTTPAVVPTRPSVATTSTSTAPALTTTVPIATTLPADLTFDGTSATSAAEFDTTGDDLIQVIINWVGLFNYFEARPTGTTQEMVNRLYDPGFPGRPTQLANFRELVANDWKYADPGENLIAVQVLEQSDTTALIRVATSRGEQLVVDPSGAEVKRYLGWEPKYVDFTFTRANVKGEWRAADSAGPEPLTPDILAAMQPVAWTLR